MKNFLVILMVALVAIIPCAPAYAVIPVCHLGGPTAMNTARELADGETFVITDRPLVVNLQFRSTAAHPEKVGECMLPSGTKVAVKDGILQWVAECGNNEVNKNIFVKAFTPPLRGLPGRDGIDGRDGKDGRDAAVLTVVEKKSHRHKHTALWVIGGIILAGGIGAVVAGGGHKEGPKVTTLPPCTQAPCLVTGGGGIKF